MKKFTFLQKWRNKIRISSDVELFIAKGVKLVNCDIRIQGKNCQFIVEEGSTIRSTQIEILGDGSSIKIGKDSKIGHNSYISAKEGKQLTIGDECMLSRNVKVMTSDGHPLFQDGKIINQAKDIVIGNHVWLADNVSILKGVNIGSNSVVGINSTLTKGIPEKSIAVGNPARVVKENIDWKE